MSHVPQPYSRRVVRVVIAGVVAGVVAARLRHTTLGSVAPPTGIRRRRHAYVHRHQQLKESGYGQPT